MVMILVVIMFPASFFMLLASYAEEFFGRNSFGAAVANALIPVCVYFSGVYAAYRHLLWREDYIAHMLEPEQKTESND